MRKDRVFFCHWWVFLPSSSEKIHVITQLSSQVIYPPLCRKCEHCHLLTRSWYKEGRSVHLPPACWKRREGSTAWRAHTASSLGSLGQFPHSHTSQLSRASLYSLNLLPNSSPLTTLAPLIYRGLLRHLFFLSSSQHIFSSLSLRKGIVSPFHAKSCPSVPDPVFILL